MSSMTEQFSGAIRRGAHNRQATPPAGREFQAMEEAHRGVTAFMAEVMDVSREVLLAYNEAATANGARTRLGWRVVPGRFDRPASEYGQDGGVPWLVMTDLACGVDIHGLAFTRLEEDRPGYRLAGTGIIITRDGEDGVLKETARETIPGLVRKMERYLERQGYR